jgi:hypothetical protein
MIQTTAMPDLNTTLSTVLCERFESNAARIRELARSLTEEQFWRKPFPFGNSFGHLVLHLTGNLNYYIGAKIAKTGYVRNRPLEFNDSSPPSKEEALKNFDNAIAMVLATIRKQSSDNWSADYAGEGTDSKTHLAITVQCAAHMQHHIGQMIYLVYEFKRQTAS